MKAVFPRGTRGASRATLASRASHAGLPISASLAVKAVLPIEAVLPVLARRAVLSVKAVFPRGTRGASRATLAGRASHAGQPTLTLQSRRTSDATIAGDSLLPRGTVGPTAEADEVRDTGGKSLTVPEIQLPPLFKILIPHPQQAGMLLIPGIAHGSMAGQAGAVVNQSMNGLDRGKLQNRHEKAPGFE